MFSVDSPELPEAKIATKDTFEQAVLCYYFGFLPKLYVYLKKTWTIIPAIAPLKVISNAVTVISRDAMQEASWGYVEM